MKPLRRTPPNGACAPRSTIDHSPHKPRRSSLRAFVALTIGAFLYACAEAPDLGIPDEEPLSEVEAEVLDGASAASHGGRTVRRVSGNGQRGDPGEVLDDPFVAQVVDGSGRPIRGLLVNWFVSTGNGEVDNEWVRTDENGRVQARLTMGTDVTKQRTIARIDGARISFVATAEGSGGSSGPAGTVVVTPSELEVTQGESESLSATVYGSDGKVDGKASVRWSSSRTSVATVNSSGTVTALATGSAEITARSGDMGSKSTVRVVEGSSGGGSLSIARVSGNAQTGVVEEQLKEPLRVRVSNGSASPASGQKVKWSVIQGSGTVSETHTRTDQSGHAQSDFTLGSEEAAQKVRASVSDKRVTFTAMGQASGGGSGQLDLRRDGGNGQTGPVGEVLPQAMRVKLLDGSGDPIRGTIVEWSVEAGGGSVDNPITTTNEEGKAQIRMTLG
ncbi:MAG: Ig-like domain-containing protein [Longimicrobiales bacterium]